MRRRFLRETAQVDTGATNRIDDAQGAEWEGGSVGFRVARTAVGGIQSPLITQQPKDSELPWAERLSSP